MSLAASIDHTILKADCTISDIEKLCQEAKEHQFAAVCVPPYFVKKASQLLLDTFIKTSTVVGFPQGYSTTAAKVEEIKRAFNDGADEIDMVVNICAIRAKNWAYVTDDIDSCTRAAHLRGKVIKIIFETGLLERSEIIELCKICDKVGVNYVKTSTGFNGDGASVEIVKLLRANLSEDIKIKASAGIRTSEDANKLLAAGAQRLGTSAGITLVS